ncbi:unnamed protein product [Cylindrotheca closterium]|uniref:Circumsporozoite protein n=1 Tax=Cylindrotheca closterium TaxID=2856 RepID=A0AAD2FZ27_9STRA|nr:unnamed protein product [Cylindrotheca closterium]
MSTKQFSQRQRRKLGGKGNSQSKIKGNSKGNDKGNSRGKSKGKSKGNNKGSKKQSGGVRASGTRIQKKPCTLFFEARDNLDEDEFKWRCRMKGQDATNAGALLGGYRANVDIQGIEHVLAAKPDIVSGETLLFAEDAVIESGLLVITPNSELKFDAKRRGNGIESRRRLATSTGNKNVLVVRVVTNDAQPTASIAEISDAVFGTDGDPVNLKSQYEGCSNDQIIIDPATGSGTACADDPNYLGFFQFASGNYADCDWFEFFQNQDPTTCNTYGNDADLGGGPETGNSACCVCGGGTTSNYNNNVIDGVFEINVPVAASSLTSSQLEDVAMNELESQFGSSNLEDQFDLIMLCLPPGTTDGNWVAYAGLPGYVSVYNDDACLYPSVQMHEVGHNVGLTHASDNTDVDVEYGDRTGMMGISYFVDDGPSRAKMCFNPAKSYTLGWYSDKNLDIDAATTPFCGTLVGVANYPTIAGDEKVVLKIPDAATDYYVGYNHAVGFHEGTNEAVNQVTIVSQNPAFGSFSNLEARLSVGDEYIISNIFGSGEDLTIRVVEIDTSAGGFAEVQVFQGTQTCASPFPSAVPSTIPSAKPSVVPSVAPSQSPSIMPSVHPSAKPSIGPSQVPSASPSIGPSQSPSIGPSKTPSLSTSPTTALASMSPSHEPSGFPSLVPSQQPSHKPSNGPSTTPSIAPSQSPSKEASDTPSTSPSIVPSLIPSAAPSNRPSIEASDTPSISPSIMPSMIPSSAPSNRPSKEASSTPTTAPSTMPSIVPSTAPSTSGRPSTVPSAAPSRFPSTFPSLSPTTLNNPPDKWNCILNEDFENGFQFLSDGGGTAAITNFGGSNDALILTGRNAVSSETNEYGVSQYSRIRLSFAYRTTRLSSQDGFNVDIQINGGMWYRWQRFGKNDYCSSSKPRWCTGQVDLALSGGINTVKIQFHTLHSRGRNKAVYIDDVQFEAYGPPSSTTNGQQCGPISRSSKGSSSKSAKHSSSKSGKGSSSKSGTGSSSKSGKGSSSKSGKGSSSNSGKTSGFGSRKKTYKIPKNVVFPTLKTIKAIH